MPHSVFISYARDASRSQAEAIYQALGGADEDICFLDTEEIGIGEPFPERLVDELFGARVVVILAEPTYFTRRYCLQEFHIASGPFSRLLEGSRPTEKQKEEALRGIVVALPERGVDPMMERFPTKIAGRNWPRADQADEIAALVRAELTLNPPTLRERYAALGAEEDVRALFLAKSALPTPLRIGSIPMAPTLGISVSIGDAFVGRADDMWRIHDVLTSRRGDLRTAAGITGSIEAGGGFGKTRIAVEYLYRFGTRTFQGGLFWIDAEQDPEDRLYEILVALSPSVDSIDVIRARRGGVAAAVARAIRNLPPDSPPPLFIVDNVPEPSPGESPKPLETWCPVPGEVSVLTTSRTQVALSIGRVEAVQIDVLNPEAAIDLLSASVRGITREDWAPVAEWVGYLPLALELLNRAMKAGALTPGDLLTANREGNATIKPLDDARLALREVVREDALPGVTQAFLLSYERLTHEQQTAARLLGWMAPSPIPRAVLEEFGSDSFPAAVRAVLRSRSFVTGVGDGEGEYFGVMHRVLADFLLSQSAALEVEATHVTKALLESMVRVRGTGDAGLAHVRRCAPAIVSVLDHLTVQPRDDHGWINLVGTFGTRAGSELSHWMLPDLTEAVLQRVVSFASIRLGEQHPNTLAVINNLAATRFQRGDLPGAQQLFEMVLNFQRARLGDEHANTLSTMHNLAGVYRGRGYLLRAKEIEEQVLERRRRTGDEHPGTLSAAINLASTLRELGELDSAESLLVGVIGTMLRVLGADHPHTLTAMGNLANTKHVQGDFIGARELQECVLAGRQRTLGFEHSDTLDAMSNLALTLRKQGELAAATTLVEHILRVRERLLGRADEKTLDAMLEVAALRSEHNDVSMTQQIAEEVLATAQTTLGPKHTVSTRAAWFLALAHFRLGNEDTANEIVEKHLAWLLDHDIETLTGIQREIRSLVEQIVVDE